MAVASEGQGAAVARLMGRDISASELAPPAADIKREKRAKTEAQFKEWLRDYPKDRLSGLIWESLRESFCKGRDCTATEKEIADFTATIDRRMRDDAGEWRQRLEQVRKELKSGSHSKEKRKALEAEKRRLETSVKNAPSNDDRAPDATDRKISHDIAKTCIEAWKFNRALYRKYGGRAIFQQAGIEPIDAYRKFLEEHEAKRTFEISDPALRREFWKYFTEMQHSYLDAKDVDFETPWWDMKVGKE